MNKKWLQLLSWLAYGLAIAFGAVSLIILLRWWVDEPGYEPLYGIASLIVTVFAALGGWFAGRYAAGDRDQTALSLPEPTAEQERRYRETLLQNLEHSWNEGLLEQSLHVATFIELRKLSRADLVPEIRRGRVYTSTNPTPQSLDDIRILDLFRRSRGSMLNLGDPGSGKTQLAVEYCYRYAGAYPGGVFWVNAAEPLQQGLAALGQRLLEAEMEVGTELRHS